MIFLKQLSKVRHVFNPIFIPCFSESMFFRIQVFQSPDFSGSSLFRVQIFQGLGFLGSRFFWVQVQGLGPGFTSSLKYLVYPFNKAAGLKAWNSIKKRLQHRCFPVNTAKFLRTPFLQNTSGSRSQHKS